MRWWETSRIWTANSSPVKTITKSNYNAVVVWTESNRFSGRPNSAILLAAEESSCWPSPRLLFLTSKRSVFTGYHLAWKDCMALQECLLYPRHSRLLSVTLRSIWVGDGSSGESGFSGAIRPEVHLELLEQVITASGMVTANAQHFWGLHTIPSPLFAPSSPSISNLLINSFMPHAWEIGTDFHCHIVLNAWQWNTNSSFILTPSGELLRIPRHPAVSGLPRLFLHCFSHSCFLLYPWITLCPVTAYFYSTLKVIITNLQTCWEGKPPETANVSNYEVKAALLSYLLLYYTLNSLKMCLATIRLWDTIGEL